MRLGDPRASISAAQLLFLLALVLLLSGCGRSMMATPSLYRDSNPVAFDTLAPELRGNRVQVLYVTDRKPATPDTRESRFYSSGRSASSVLGVADVQLGSGTSPRAGADGDTSSAPGRPSDSVSGSSVAVVSAKELVRFPATPYLFRIAEGGQVKPDPEVVAELEQATAAARREVVRRLALTPRKEVFVFVHGVANQFEDPIIGVAEFWHFLGREGIPIAYTWPAGAKGLIFYTADRESGEFTVLHLKQFLEILASIPEVEKIHIGAHSRGTDVVTTALRELVIGLRSAGEDPRTRLKIDNLVLVAADLDLGVAMQRIAGEALGLAVGRTTIYVNPKDKALAAARALFSSRLRLGALEPTKLTDNQRIFVRRAANLDLILFEGTGGGTFRHGYFRDPIVSSDILMVLRYDLRPGEGKRQNLERVDENIWRLTARDRSS